MGFEKEKKLPQNISSAEREKQKPNIYYLGEEENLQCHVKYEMLSDCIKKIGKQNVKVIDYGAGNGRLTNILSTLTDCSEELQNVKMEVIGYEPDAEMVRKSIERSKKNDFSCARHTSEKPDEEADVVLCHFSLHHMEDGMEKILEEEIRKKINPEYIIIGEFDYKGNNITIQEFKKLFLSTESGKEELGRYKEYGSEQGLQKCYEEHMKIGLQDCVNVLEKIGYKVEGVAIGNTGDPTQMMKFIIKAKRVELDKIEYKS
ncbi:MAG: methyltransferase domain-containing protein [bacterium]